MLWKAWTYLLGEVGDARISRAADAALLVGALVALAWLAYFAGATLFMPYPLEFREGAAQVMTKLLLSGTNPYSPENQPLGMNGYGIAYYLMVLPFAAILGNTLFAHRLISAVFVLLSALLVFETIRKARGNSGLALACASLVAMALAARAGFGAFPSAAGAFFFLAAIIIPFNRSFDAWGLGLSAALGLIGFYTKPYFVLSMAIVFSYVFLFISMKRALLYGLGFALAFSASFVVVRSVLPLYYFDVAIINLSHAKIVPSWATFQLQELVLEFYPVLIVALVVLLEAAAALLRRKAPGRTGPPRGRALSLDAALIAGPRLSYFAHAAIVSALAFVLILGPSRGAYMTYAYQLILPPFFLWLGLTLRGGTRLGLIVAPLLILGLFNFADKRLNPSMLDQRRSEAWASVYERLAHAQRVLNSPVLVSEMIRLGMQPLDSGHTEYYYNIAREDYPGDSLLGPSFDVIQDNGHKYLNSIEAAVKQRQFDALMLTANWGLPQDMDLIRANYRLDESITVPMPQRGQTWAVDIWLPIER
jgi:hypothetical protein